MVIKQKDCICENCGAINSKQEVIEGGRSVILFVLLLCFMIVPGLLYWGFKSKAKKKIVCKACGVENKICPINTPGGMALYKKYYGDSDLKNLSSNYSDAKSVAVSIADKIFKSVVYFIAGLVLLAGILVIIGWVSASA